jgi:ribosomal protein S18 acetylase RimI-like enzyme
MAEGGNGRGCIRAQPSLSPCKSENGTPTVAPMGEIELRHLDGAGTLGRFAAIQQVYAVAFPASDLDDHRWRTTRQAGRPGFEAVLAQDDGVLAGFAYGLPLDERTGWWDGLRPPPEQGFTTETGRRTFAVIDLAVLPSHRGRGLGRRLLDDLLAARPEERATLATDPAQKAVQEMYERWGWRMVGTTPGGARTTHPAFDLYVIALGADSDSR